MSTSNTKLKANLMHNSTAAVQVWALPVVTWPGAWHNDSYWLQPTSGQIIFKLATHTIFSTFIYYVSRWHFDANCDFQIYSHNANSTQPVGSHPKYWTKMITILKTWVVRENHYRSYQVEEGVATGSHTCKKICGQDVVRRSQGEWN